MKFPSLAKPKEMKLDRRKALKTLLFGGGLFLAGKIFGPSITLFSDELEFGGEKGFNFKNFRVIETGGELRFFDRMGNEILTLEKDAQ